MSSAAGDLIAEKGVDAALQELRDRATALVQENCENYDVQELRSGFRGLVEHIKFRLEIEGYPSRAAPNTTAIIHYIAGVTGKKFDSVYTWQSDSKHHYPIQWETLEMLRLDEWAIAHREHSVVAEGFRQRYERHARAEAAPREIPKRKKAKPQVPTPRKRVKATA